MMWEDFWSTKLSAVMRQELREHALTYAKERAKLKHLTNEHDRWISALENYYFRYLQTGLIDKEPVSVAHYLKLGNIDGICVLHRAVLGEQMTFVQFLLEKGADPYAETKTGKVGAKEVYIYP